MDPTHSASCLPENMFIISNVLMIFLSLIRLAVLKVWSVRFLQKAKQLSEHGLIAPVTLATCSECVRATRADMLVPNRSAFLPAAHSLQQKLYFCFSLNFWGRVFLYSPGWPQDYISLEPVVILLPLLLEGDTMSRLRVFLAEANESLCIQGQPGLQSETLFKKKKTNKQINKLFLMGLGMKPSW